MLCDLPSLPEGRALRCRRRPADRCGEAPRQVRHPICASPRGVVANAILRTSGDFTALIAASALGGEKNADPIGRNPRVRNRADPSSLRLVGPRRSRRLSPNPHRKGYPKMLLAIDSIETLTVPRLLLALLFGLSPLAAVLWVKRILAGRRDREDARDSSEKTVELEKAPTEERPLRRFHQPRWEQLPSRRRMDASEARSGSRASNSDRNSTCKLEL